MINTSKTVILGTYENIKIFEMIGFDTLVTNSIIQTKQYLQKLLREDVTTVFIQEDFLDDEIRSYRHMFPALITIPFSKSYK